MVLENEPMALHTTFKIGGPIRAIVYPNTFEALGKVMGLLGARGVEPFVLGNGSNLLCGDGAIDRIAVCTRPGGSDYLPYMELIEKTEVLAVSAGAMLPQVAMLALGESLSGMEFAAGIPGTLGGAVRMNAGAYGREMKDIVRMVETITLEGQIKLYLEENLEFSYRHSIFSERSDEIISKVFLNLEPGERDEIQAEMRKLSNKRKASQPLDLPSAGSTFKRPAGGYAAELIDKAGLKGFAVGGAQVSEKHAGFIVNRGGATCDDVLRVMEHVQEEVLKQFGVALEPEVLLVR
jgi:UDP-N-acetylmuramate dehydrogenase